jgi:hypothetical protein
MSARFLRDADRSQVEAVMRRTFDLNESHYIASRASELDSQDIEDAVKLVTSTDYYFVSDSIAFAGHLPVRPETGGLCTRGAVDRRWCR